MDKGRKHILIAMDGSEQSLGTVRYIGSLFRERQVKITLFHVMDLLPENLSDYKSGPDLRYEVSRVREWAFDQMGRIEAFMEHAVRLLTGMGYKEDRITVIVKDRVAGIVRDLHREGQRGVYDALVIGRSGISLIKDLDLSSISNMLVGLLSQLPVWVVGGSPDTSKILVAMDTSREAKRALDYAANAFPNTPHPEFLLLHVSSKIGPVEPEFSQLRVVHESRDWTERVADDFRAGERGMESYLQECVAGMERRGVNRNRVKTKVIDVSKSRSETILREAVAGNYGTIVLGRRTLSKVDEVIRGRVSGKVIQLAKENAVWLVH